MRNLLFIVSGPSGVGKGTIVKELIKSEKSLALSVSCTTRAPRKGEVDGREYFFIPRSRFLEMIEGGEFLEYDEHFDHFYGTPKKYVEDMLKQKSVILEIDVVGAMKVKSYYEGKAYDPVVLIMVEPPDAQSLIDRLKGRGSENEETLKKRRARAEYELSAKKYYNYSIINDELPRAIEEMRAVMKSEMEKSF